MYQVTVFLKSGNRVEFGAKEVDVQTLGGKIHSYTFKGCAAIIAFNMDCIEAIVSEEIQGLEQS